MFFFTADEHYCHKNIIKYCNRPFNDIKTHNECLINNYNEVVKKGDITVHVGDFCLGSSKQALDIINRLNGGHIFIEGSHDAWLKKAKFIIRQSWERKIDNQWIVANHYPGRSWAKSHYGSWQVHGHHHGNLKPLKLQYDVGVDNNNYYPVSFNRLKLILGGENSKCECH